MRQWCVGGSAYKVSSNCGTCELISPILMGIYIFAVKEHARRMADFEPEDFLTDQRIARYLKGCPRGIVWCKFQSVSGTLQVYTDSDRAGCRTTRMLTSGGCIFSGLHVLILLEQDPNHNSFLSGRGRTLCGDTGDRQGARDKVDVQRLGKGR